MKVLIINSMSGQGSTGRIVEGIADVLTANGHDAHIAYSAGNTRHANATRFGNRYSSFVHKCMSHAFDMQGLWSILSTKKLIRHIKSLSPDLINLHTIHGNYLNYPLLFSFLKKYGRPVVWTLHDCWSFTGHCPHFIYQGCYRWTTHCHDCPQLWMYPKSNFWDGSSRNHRLKKKYFCGFGDKLTIVTVSEWLAGLASKSILSGYRIKTIHNGIDLNIFKPTPDNDNLRKKYSIPEDRHIVLAVASPWTTRKGFPDLLKLRELLDTDSYTIVIVGVSDNQASALPGGVIGIPRTESATQLAAIYSLSTVMVNPTYEDCYPTVNLESIACGTPVITYRTGGSPEAIIGDTGLVVEQGNITQLADAVRQISEKSAGSIRAKCREVAERHFSQDNAFAEYVTLFEGITAKKNQ